MTLISISRTHTTVGNPSVFLKKKNWNEAKHVLLFVGNCFFLSFLPSFDWSTTTLPLLRLCLVTVVVIVVDAVVIAVIIRCFLYYHYSAVPGIARTISADTNFAFSLSRNRLFCALAIKNAFCVALAIYSDEYFWCILFIHATISLMCSTGRVDMKWLKKKYREQYDYESKNIKSHRSERAKKTEAKEMRW